MLSASPDSSLPPGRQHLRKVSILASGVPVMYAYPRTCTLGHNVVVLTSLLVLVSATKVGAAAVDVQPAIDLIERNFGEVAASKFSLSLGATRCENGGGEVVKAPCFSLAYGEGKITIHASSMSELTYGIGYYARFSCGMTVGWKRGGGSFTGNNATDWQVKHYLYLYWLLCEQCPLSRGRTLLFTLC